jgi:tRNA(Ile)-lysidine synthase
MARARDVRWESLEIAAHKCKAAWIATAHHVDDLAETVLIRILRGAPLQGLAVLPAVSFRKDGLHRIRPLIAARRVDIDYHLKKRNVPFATDPSNNSPKYLRARVRNEVLPMLRSIDPKIVDHLANLAEEAFVEFGCQDFRLNEVEDGEI